jgi:hypothetical protein
MLTNNQKSLYIIDIFHVFKMGGGGEDMACIVNENKNFVQTQKQPSIITNLRLEYLLLGRISSCPDIFLRSCN